MLCASLFQNYNYILAIRGQRPLAPLGGDSSAHRTAQRTALATVHIQQ
jgi:hypothetical protein